MRKRSMGYGREEVDLPKVLFSFGTSTMKVCRWGNTWVSLGKSDLKRKPNRGRTAHFLEVVAYSENCT